MTRVEARKLEQKAISKGYENTNLQKFRRISSTL